MAKKDIEFVCENCQVVQSKWLGKCPNCGNFNTLIERPKAPKATAKSKNTKNAARAALVPKSGDEAIPLNEIRAEDWPRLALHSPELNNVLGGGLTPGSTILLGGAPGAGKSTMMSAIAGYLATNGDNVLYASAEESPQQIKMRMDRLGIDSENLYLMNETNLDNILKQADILDPIVLIVDSIQMIYSSLSDSSPGTVTQVRECAAILNNFAKSYGISVLIISQMTKSDDFAGPRLLEHIVDATLYLEGDDNGEFRILRSIKNRFGVAPEIGVFQMGPSGFEDVPNPSEIFLAERNASASGTTIAAMIDGLKALLIEVQALVSNTDYSSPSRNTTGFDRNRITKIADVLSKHIPCDIVLRNITVNIVGGIQGIEPAMDLPVAIAMLSSFLGRIVPGDLVSFGEIGLTGEIRSVSRIDLRIKEAKKIGMKHVIIPANKRNSVQEQGLFILPVKNVRDVMNIVEKFPWDPAFKYEQEHRRVQIESTRLRRAQRDDEDLDPMDANDGLMQYLDKVPVP